ncbi:MAG: NADH-quinone oxidoreductase subunit L [Sulfurospirillaceae bacterium]|nr:NADH-quinone oxidoreductase subunit L [Sulfurospirillaceae bacterium]
MNTLLMWIVLSPLLTSIFIGMVYMWGLKYHKLARQWYIVPALISPFVSFVLACFVFWEILTQNNILVYKPYVWLSIENVDIYMGFLGDKLSILMVLFVSFVGWMIHIYASAYMQDDEGEGKFFFYFNLFLASMLLLVLADGPLIMFIGWEGVGVCSYLLIGFYFRVSQNVVAGNKAFIVNRVGDFGFVIGMVTLFFYCTDVGFDYASIKQVVGNIPSFTLAFIGLMLFVGAMGKSAQIPLYVWLPDAMAGPTPVSALIHAATMVTAGVYMVARFNFLYELIPQVGVFIAYVGALSAFFAAIIATKQTDIKKILAYSTMSQLGYMFIAVGLGGYASGVFHVFTHAFFKALLFMGAGAVMTALHHEQDIFKMGGLRQKLPLVHGCMLVATLALCGIPPFAGFFSKDQILLEAFASGHYLLWSIATLTAGLSAYYMFRLFFVVFEGKNYNSSRHIHRLSKTMQVPIFVLAIGSLMAGFIGVPLVLGGDNHIASYLFEWTKKSLHVEHSIEFALMGLSVTVALVGVVLAYVKFYRYDFKKEYVSKGIVYNKFYVDEFYHLLIVLPLQSLSSFIASRLDIQIIDALIMGACRGVIKGGRFVSLLQNANTRFYSLLMMCGVSVFFIYLILVLG